MVALTKDEGTMEMPEFLRRYSIDGLTLERLIVMTELLLSHVTGYGPDHFNRKEIDEFKRNLAELQKRKAIWPARQHEPVEAPKPKPVDPNTISLTAPLKERVGLQIIKAIDASHNYESGKPQEGKGLTFARLRKAIPVLHIEGQDIDMPDRVLKSALNYLMSGKLKQVRVVKLSPKVYGVQRR